MASSQQWKEWERQLARDLGGKRTGPTGRNDCDVSDVPLGVEAKYMQKLSLQATHIKQARTNAGDKPWILALREAKSGKRLVVMDYKFFLDLYNKVYKKENA